MTVVGVTGGISSGKSTVSSFFKELGACVLDADRMVHLIYKTDARVKNLIRKKISEDIFVRGEIDKKGLAEIVFTNEKKLRCLEHIVHPVVIKKIKREIGKRRKGVLVIDAPLLLEAGLGHMVDYIVAVKAPLRKQLNRAKKNGVSEKEARKRLLFQMPQPEKQRIADFVIDTGGSKKQTKRKVKEIWQRLNRRSRKWIT